MATLGVQTEVSGVRGISRSACGPSQGRRKVLADCSAVAAEWGAEKEVIKHLDVDGNEHNVYRVLRSFFFLLSNGTI